MAIQSPLNNIRFPNFLDTISDPFTNYSDYPFDLPMQIVLNSTGKLIRGFRQDMNKRAVEFRNGEVSDLEVIRNVENKVFYTHARIHGSEQVWKLWNEGKIVNVMDPAIYDSGSGIEDDIVRYANVGLLCVQETASDRPNTCTVLSMLNCEIVELPHPKQPAFLGMQSSQGTESATTSSSKYSANNLTISIVEGR